MAGIKSRSVRGSYGEKSIRIMQKAIDACAGMADPQAEILALRQEIRELLIDQDSILKSHTEEQNRADRAEAEVARLREALELLKSGSTNYLDIKVIENALANHSVE